MHRLFKRVYCFAVMLAIFCGWAVCAFGEPLPRSDKKLRAEAVERFVRERGASICNDVKTLVYSELKFNFEHISVPEIYLAPRIPSFADNIINSAMQYLGVKYVYGKSGPNGFDCSGFTSYVYRQWDIELNRSSRSQFLQGESVDSISDLQRGDLVFFGGRRSTKSVGHVGIVVDVDPVANTFTFIHASRKKGIAIDESSAAYYAKRYIGAKRVIDTDKSL